MEKREREKKDCNTEYNKAPKTPPSILEREFKRRTGLRKLFNPPCSSQVFDASFGVSAAIGYLRGCSYTRARAHTQREVRLVKRPARSKFFQTRKPHHHQDRTNIARYLQCTRTISLSLSLSTLVFLFPQPPILRFSAFSPATKCTLVTRDHRARIRPSKYLQLKRNSAFAHARHV